MSKTNKTNRRDTIKLGLMAGLAAGLGSFYSRPAKAAMIVKMGVGLGEGAAALIYSLERDKFLEKAADKLGIETIQPEYLTFDALLRMVQALQAGQLMFGTIGSTPTIRNVSGDSPLIPIAISNGGGNFPLLVPNGSPIKSLDDLRGKTILTLVGSDLHLCLLMILNAHFGTNDTQALGIKVVNVQAYTEFGQPRPGVDAVLSVDPWGDDAATKGTMKILMGNNGLTGAAYDGPEGKGAGHVIASFSKSPFYPEAYYPHRNWWVVAPRFLQDNEKAVEAFLIANSWAVSALKSASVDQVVDTSNKFWVGDRSVQRRLVETIIWRKRGWNWISEGDARSLIVLSSNKVIFEKPLAPSTLLPILAKGAPVAKRAWIGVGQIPPLAEFTNKNAKDVRGLPTWEQSAWRL